MSAIILEFKQKNVTLSAVCNTCETSWKAIMPAHRYEMYVKTNKKCICPFCGHTEIGLAKTG